MGTAPNVNVLNSVFVGEAMAGSVLRVEDLRLELGGGELN